MNDDMQPKTRVLAALVFGMTPVATAHAFPTFPVFAHDRIASSPQNPQVRSSHLSGEFCVFGR
mgnify:FL=1